MKYFKPQKNNLHGEAQRYHTSFSTMDKNYINFMKNIIKKSNNYNTGIPTVDTQKPIIHIIITQKKYSSKR